MTLKQCALALGLLASAPSFAAIANNNDAELFAVVWDETAGSYTVDTGIKLGDFLSGSSQLGYSFSVDVGPSFGAYLAADTDLNDSGVSSGTRWALFAADIDGLVEPGELRYLTTANGSAFPADSIRNGDWTVPQGNMGLLTVDINQTGTHVPGDFAQNGDSFNPAATVDDPAPIGTFVEANYFGVLGLAAGNAIGASSQVFITQTSSFDSFDFIQSQATRGIASFDGRTFTYATPIPEPETYALMLAGLGVVATVVRRRRAA